MVTRGWFGGVRQWWPGCTIVTGTRAVCVTSRISNARLWLVHSLGTGDTATLLRHFSLVGGELWHLWLVGVTGRWWHCHWLPSPHHNNIVNATIYSSHIWDDNCLHKPTIPSVPRYFIIFTSQSPLFASSEALISYYIQLDGVLQCWEEDIIVMWYWGPIILSLWAVSNR